jgi:hypothetical protein
MAFNKPSQTLVKFARSRCGTITRDSEKRPQPFQWVSTGRCLSRAMLSDCARNGSMRHDPNERAIDPVGEEHRTGVLQAVQDWRDRATAQ